LKTDIDFARLDQIFAKGTKEELLSFCSENDLEIKDGKIVAIDPVAAKANESFWDKRQLVRKILLNSLYGALLNAGSRFFDFRLGQSTTLTGRGIDQHMAAGVNEIITGVYQHDGAAILYCDTDSSYFTAYPTYKPMIDSGEINWDVETIITLYDEICRQINDTFVDHMARKHHCPTKNGAIIKAAREVVAEKTLFIKKKKYALLVIDDGGKRKDVGGKRGKLKVTGLDIKRSDTPAFVQNFLEEIVMMTLTGISKEEIIQRIIKFRTEFRAMPSWHKGTPKQVNNLTSKTKTWRKTGKCGVGHVLAAINYNELLKLNNDTNSMPIVDSMKTIVCKLKDNQFGMTSIGIPTDESRVPDWFKALPFDDNLMEDTLIDKKLDNVIGCLDWDISSSNIKTTFNDLFGF
jgi:hypothetical protein